MGDCFIREEIREYVKTLKARKATGRDGIPNAFYKEGGPGVNRGAV